MAIIVKSAVFENLTRPKRSKGIPASLTVPWRRSLAGSRAAAAACAAAAAATAARSQWTAAATPRRTTTSTASV